MRAPRADIGEESLDSICCSLNKERGKRMLYIALYYVAAITILVLHFTGWLARRNLEWLVLVLAVSVFPAVIYL